MPCDFGCAMIVSSFTDEFMSMIEVGGQINMLKNDPLEG